MRRYYLPSTQHGGGPGGFSTAASAPPSCPSVGWGTGALPNNPVPHTQTVNAIRAHFRDWVMKGVAPPQVRMGHIFQAVLPYIVMSLLLLALVFFIPAVAVWLPKVLV